MARRARGRPLIMAGHRRRDATQREPPGIEAAVEIAARFLGTRPRSRWEVERRLQRASAAPEVIQTALDRLARLGYVDDFAFARWWLEQRDRHAPRGRRLLEAELRQHGVAREVLEAIRDEAALQPSPDPDAEVAKDRARDPTTDGEPTAGEPLSEDERALAALARHLRGRLLPTDRAVQQRVAMYLMRRGFDSETARRAMKIAEDPGADDGD